MKNLSLKPNALDSLDLPFRVSHGKIGLLSANIPWTSIYTSPVIIKLSNVLAVAIPNVDSSYDEERETAIAEAAKQKALQKLEDALKKNSEKTGSSTSAKDKQEGDDFVSKLTAQIIKNLQVRIDNVHIRFEDNFTDPLSPYFAGITLDQMVFETQKSDKQAKYSSTKSDDVIYKLVALQKLSIYWNIVSPGEESNCFISHFDIKDEMADDILINCIASRARQPAHLEYLLRPITFEANAMINRKPHLDDFTVPVVDLELSLDDFKLGFSTYQFESLLQLADNLSRMRLAYPHRKFRPSVPLHNNAKVWWQFAQNAIIENEVRRKNKLWSWTHMKEHRKTLKVYTALYKRKLLNPKDTSVSGQVIQLEKSLDVFNIVLARRSAEADVAVELKRLRAEKKSPEKKPASKGWFSGWWTSSTEDTEDTKTDEISDANVIENIKLEMTPEEKAKLYAAIGYDSDALSIDYPASFEAHILSIVIRSIKLVLFDASKNERLLELALLDVLSTIKHRPSSRAWHLTCSVDDLNVFGAKNRPMIQEETKEKAFLFDFITSPIDASFDFGIKLKTSPLHFIYDPDTVNTIFDIFTRRSHDLSYAQIQAIAEARLNRLKRMSASGLEYAVRKHRNMNIDIDFAPFFLIIPSGNIWTDDRAEAIVCCLGRVSVLSKSQRRTSFNVSRLSKDTTQDEIIALARERAYESFNLSLSDVQIFLTTGAKWKEDIGYRDGSNYAISSHVTPILLPISLNVLLQRCIVNDDPDLPNLKMKAEVPSIALITHDTQLLKTLTILTSVPLPTRSSRDEESSIEIMSIGAQLDQPDYASDALLNLSAFDTVDTLDPNQSTTKDVSVVDFNVEFVVREINIELLSGNVSILRACGSSSDDSTRDMIFFSITSKEAADGMETVSCLDMKGFTLIFALDYLMKVSNDFSQILADSSTENDGRISPFATTTAVTTTTSAAVASDSVFTAPNAQAVIKAAKKQSALSFKFQMSKINLVLIEASPTSDIPAVIFNNLIEIDIRKKNNQLSVTGKIAQNQLSMTNLTRYLEQGEVEAMILPPADFAFILHLDTETNRKHIDVSIDAISISISPNTVQVLLSLLSSINSDKKVTQVSNTQDSIMSAEILLRPSKWNEQDHWFLCKPCATAIEATEETVMTPDSARSLAEFDGESERDQCFLNIPSVIVILESGGADSRPLLTFQSSLVGQLVDWNTFKMTTSLSMSYYNEKLHVWEPVIELKSSKKPLDFTFHGTLATENKPTKITSESNERLELTVSKTFLSVTSRLGEAFGKAVKKSERLLKKTDVVHVTNLTGIPIDLYASEYKYHVDAYPMVTQGTDYYRSIRLLPGQKEEKILDCKTSLKPHSNESSDLIIKFTYRDITVLRQVSIASHYQRIHSIPGSHYAWIAAVEIPEMGVKKVTIGTPVEIINNFRKQVQVYYINEENEAELVSTINTLTRSFLPLDAIYIPSDLLFFSAGDDYCIPNQGIVWTESNNHEKPIFIRCDAKDEDQPNAHMTVISKTTTVLRDDSTATDTITTIEINPTLIFQNLLPFEVSYQLIGCSPVVLSPGESHQLIQFDPDVPLLTLEIPNYLGYSWYCSKPLAIKNFSGDDVYVWSFSSTTPGPVVSLTNPPKNKSLHLIVSLVKSAPTKPLTAQLFAPFWLINKTGMSLAYKSSDQLWEHPSNYTDPIVFSFRPGKLWKQKMTLQCGNSHWSEQFSIDAVGNQGNIVCIGHDKVPYCISVEINLSSFSLTKLVTFRPFYTIINRTETDVDISDTGCSWANVAPVTKTSFWPQETKDGVFYIRMKDRVRGINHVSSSISYRVSDSSLIALGDLLFNVLVDVADSGITIQLSDYDEGACPVLIFNHTSSPIHYGQQGVGNLKLLLPGYSVFYLWDKPSDEKMLHWHIEGVEAVAHTVNEDSWSATPDKKYSWVSFLDGKQRVLLISQDSELTQSALQTNELTKPKIDIEMSIKGLGLSIVNNETQQDLIYLGISGSDTIWEVKKTRSKRYKPLQRNQIDVIEAAYQAEMRRRRAGTSQPASPTRGPRVISLAHKVKVDIHDANNMVIFEPVKGILRRYSAPGLWVHLSQSDHTFKAHVKISRIQIDNQMDNCLFGIIMCPVTPPKSLAQDRAPKSFIEMSLLRQQRTNVNRYKMLNFLIQEFLIQVDGAFLLAISDFLGQSNTTGELDYRTLVSSDLKIIKQQEAINDEHEIILSKAYFDCVHFSPIKLHLSFSLGGIPSFQLFGVLNLLMRSAGVTLTEFKDVVLKIDFFERRNIFLDSSELISAAQSHYLRQVLKQFYVIVLGLDVIGNPVNLVLGLRQGVGDFFYEPFLGIIEGPEEFAEGLVLGVKSLFSSTVGGAAGALSKITGTLGEGVSALTMDDEFIRRRRIRMQRNTNVAENSKELAQGFWRGLSGIIRKPVEGARDDGFGGLLKGIGKGAVGIIAQPASGVIDFASGSMGAIKKAVDINQEAKKQRPPRFFKKDGILYPYNLHEASGHQMLVSIDKGSFSKTDRYFTHIYIRHPANQAKEEVMLITDKRVFILRPSCMSSSHEVAWSELFGDILEFELYNFNTIKIILKENRRLLCIIDEGHERSVYCQSAEVAQVSVTFVFIPLSS